LFSKNNILKGAGVLLIAVLMVLSSVVAMANTIDEPRNNLTADTTPDRGEPSATKGSFPILFEFDLPNAYSVGVGFDGTYIWVSAGDQQTGFCEFYLYDQQGNLVDEAHQGGGPTGWGHRDMAWNGEYMFGSYDPFIDGFSDIYTYDGLFGGPINPNRAMAYDGTYFYTSGFSEMLWQLEWDGIWGSTATAVTLSGPYSGAYGLAYDEEYDCLWMTTADYTGDLLQFDMDGNIIDTYTCLPEYDIQGGCTMADTDDYGYVLVVLQQFSPDRITFYDVGHGVADEPDLDCEGDQTWEDVEPGSTVEGEFEVENVGDSGTLLDWEIESWPEWGEWTFDPESGEDLTPEDGPVTVAVEVVAPDDPETEFEGEIVVVNSENSADTCTIEVRLVTPCNSAFMQFLQNLAQRFPILNLIFSYLL
jgi:hypothetical protein